MPIVQHVAESQTSSKARLRHGCTMNASTTETRTTTKVFMEHEEFIKACMQTQGLDKAAAEYEWLCAVANDQVEKHMFEGDVSVAVVVELVEVMR